MTNQKTENHKYIGFHNTEEVVSFSHTDQMFAKEECEKLLLKYFHNLSIGCTLYHLDNYNGVVAYVGVKYAARKHKRNMKTRENRI